MTLSAMTSGVPWTPRARHPRGRRARRRRGTRSAMCRAAARARVVLPTPPGPISVTRRRAREPTRSSRSTSRPTRPSEAPAGWTRRAAARAVAGPHHRSDRRQASRDGSAPDSCWRPPPPSCGSRPSSSTRRCGTGRSWRARRSGGRPGTGEDVREAQVLTPGVRINELGELFRNTNVGDQGEAGPGQRSPGGQPPLLERGDSTPSPTGRSANSPYAGPRHRASARSSRTTASTGRSTLARLVEARELAVPRPRSSRPPACSRAGDMSKLPAPRLGRVERPPELRDLRGQETRRVRAVGALAPQVVDQPVGRDGLPEVDDVFGQHRAPFCSLDARARRHRARRRFGERTPKRISRTVAKKKKKSNGEMDWMTMPWSDDMLTYVDAIWKPVDTIVLGRRLAEGCIPNWAWPRARTGVHRPDEQQQGGHRQHATTHLDERSSRRRPGTSGGSRPRRAATSWWAAAAPGPRADRPRRHRRAAPVRQSVAGGAGHAGRRVLRRHTEAGTVHASASTAGSPRSPGAVRS